VERIDLIISLLHTKPPSHVVNVRHCLSIVRVKSMYMTSRQTSQVSMMFSLTLQKMKGWVYHWRTNNLCQKWRKNFVEAKRVTGQPLSHLSRIDLDCPIIKHRLCIEPGFSIEAWRGTLLNVTILLHS